VHYGDQLAICLRIMAEGAGPEHIRQRALSALDPLMIAWHEVAARQLNAAERASPVAPQDVLAVIQSVHCIERCGRAFSKKRVLKDLLGRSRFTAQAYFRWCVSLHPTGPIAAKMACDTDHMLCAGTRGPDPLVWPTIPLHLPILPTPSFTRILRGPSVSFGGGDRTLCGMFGSDCFWMFADVDIGCQYIDVLQRLPSFRPYKSVLDLPREQYTDQLNLIYHVIMTSSGWGKLQLMRELFAHEWAFLKAQLPMLVQLRDINLAGAPFAY
jgi:hypothetical protein